MFEIFNPVNGTTLFAVPFAWIARLLTLSPVARLLAPTAPMLDWAPKGEGW